MFRNIVFWKRRIKRNKKEILITTIVIGCFIAGIMGFAYFTTTGNFGGSATIIVPAFAPKVNGSTNMNQTVNLVDTITNNKNLTPGAVGKFKVDIDFTNTDTDVYYKVLFDRTNIPNNIHFYVDQDLTSELSSIEGIQIAGNPNKLAEHYIYWTWEYVNTPEANANDSLYMDQEINLPFTVYISQKIEEHTIIVNDYEKPTGRVDLVGTTGRFNIKLDFKNISVNTSYKVYFNTDGFTGLHLYSDSARTNEITSLNGYYNGENNPINTTVYFKCDSACSSNNLYYVVYLF